jgi:type I restriction enzyme S subunit
VKVVSSEEVAANDYNLSPSRFIEPGTTVQTEQLQPLLDHLAAICTQSDLLNDDLRRTFGSLGFGVPSSPDAGAPKSPEQKPADLAGSRWPLVPLREVAKSFSGGTPPKSNAAYWTGPVPWLSPKDMKASHLSDTLDHISSDAAENFSRLMPIGTVFVVVRGMILAKDLPVAICTVPMAFNQDMKALCANERILPEFLLYAIISQKSTMTKEIGTSAHGTRRIGSSSIDELLIPLPPLPEQNEIVRILRAVERAAELEQRRAAVRRQVFGSALGRLMSGELPVTPLLEHPPSAHA